MELPGRVGKRVLAELSQQVSGACKMLDRVHHIPGWFRLARVGCFSSEGELRTEEPNVKLLQPLAVAVDWEVKNEMRRKEEWLAEVVKVLEEEKRYVVLVMDASETWKREGEQGRAGRSRRTAG